MRESILAALKAVLEDIKTGNGYTLSVAHVSRQWKQVEDISSQQLPAVLIIDDGPEEIEENTGDVADVSFIVSLIGYVEDHENPSTALNELDVAVKKAVATNETLGGLITLIEIQPYRTRDVSTLPPFAWFDRPVKIYYEGTFSEGL